MDDIRQREYEATRLIQEERFDEAVEILEDVLRQDMDNVNAWWLIANAVDAPDEAREALNKVLELNPNHAKARQMLDRLNALYPPPAAPAPADAFATAGSIEEVTAEQTPTEVTMTGTEAEEAPSEAASEALEAVEEEAEDAWDFAFEEEAGAEAAAPDFPDESPAAVLSRETPFELETSPFDRPTEVAEPLPDESLEESPDEAMFDFDDDDALFAAALADEDILFDFDEGAAAGEEDAAFAGEEEAEAPRARGRGGRLLQFILMLVIIALVSTAIAILVLSQGQEAAGPPAPTANPTLTALNEANARVLTDTGAALSAAGFAEAAAAFRETPAGVGLIGLFCWPGGPGFSDASLDAMGVVTEQAQGLDGVDAVGVELALCDQLDNVIFTATAPRAQAEDFFINQDADEVAFRAGWVTGP
ncbi:MAG: hypothetical protein Kow00120_08620 [Anaerolineae bacterium]